MTQKSDSSSQKVMPVMGHMRELQIRLTISAIFVILTSSLAYVFRDQIIHLLLSPLDGQQLIYLNPAGGFSFILLVSIYTGLAVSAPLIIQQTYGFIRPILSKKSQKNSVLIFSSSLLLLVGGVAFGYIFAIPGALNFLYAFAGEYVEASLTADSYLNFIVAYTLGIGLIFQLPLILMIIHWIKPLTPGGLMKSQRWIIVFAFIAAAIITPTPDPLNQTIIALPIILIYQLGVIAVLVSIHKGKKLQKRANKPIASKKTKSTKLAQKPTATHLMQPHQYQPAPPSQAEREATIPHQQTKAATTRPTKMSGNISDIIVKQQTITQKQIEKPKAVRKIDGFIRATPPNTQHTARPVYVPERQKSKKTTTPAQRSIASSTSRPDLSLDGITRARKIVR